MRFLLHPVRLARSFTLPCLSLLCLAAPAQGQEAMEVRSAYVEPMDGIYLLSAQFAFDLPEGARQAVRDGAGLTLDIDVELNRERRFWLDDNVATLHQQYELAFHALSERYVVRNLNSGDQASFASLETALESLRTVRALPILDATLIEPGERYAFSLRATLDVRTLPDALRWVLFWADDWRQRSVWYSWSLPR